MKIEVIEANKKFYDKYDCLDFVKEHRNIFAHKIKRNVYDYGSSVIVVEYTYFYDKKNTWYWCFKKNTPYYFIYEKLDINDLLSFLNEIK